MNYKHLKEKALWSNFVPVPYNDNAINLGKYVGRVYFVYWGYTTEKDRAIFCYTHPAVVEAHLNMDIPILEEAKNRAYETGWKELEKNLKRGYADNSTKVVKVRNVRSIPKEYKDTLKYFFNRYNK